MELAVINLLAAIPVFVLDVLAFLPFLMLDIVMVVFVVMVLLRISRTASEACRQQGECYSVAESIHYGFPLLSWIPAQESQLFPAARKLWKGPKVMLMLEIGVGEPMKVLIFGATGMVGRGVLLACLRDPGVKLVVTLGRTATGLHDPKLQEIIHRDLLQYAGMEETLTGFDACFFCLGIASSGMKEADYERITFRYTMAAAELLARVNPGMTFIFISGSGTDSSEKGRVMWVRVKAPTENALLKLPLKA